MGGFIFCSALPPPVLDCSSPFSFLFSLKAHGIAIQYKKRRWHRQQYEWQGEALALAAQRGIGGHAAVWKGWDCVYTGPARL